MIVVDNPQLEAEMMALVRQRAEELSSAGGAERSGGIHLTELIYCLTSSYFNRLAPLPINDRSALTMAMGIALERTIIPLDKRAKAGSKDGIEYSPDFWASGLSGKQIINELKTTRMSTKKTITREFPESWIQQIMGYCYAEGQKEYGLSKVHLLGGYQPPFPALKSVTLIFTDNELKDNWDYLQLRRSQYIKCFAEQQPPTPYRWCKDWECKDCKYLERCTGICGASPYIRERK